MNIKVYAKKSINQIQCLKFRAIQNHGKHSILLQIKGKESENSYRELKRSQKGQAQTHGN